MGFRATVTPTLMAAAPQVPEPKGPMKTDRITATNREPSHAPPLWPTLAVVG